MSWKKIGILLSLQALLACSKTLAAHGHIQHFPTSIEFPPKSEKEIEWDVDQDFLQEKLGLMDHGRDLCF